MRRLGRVGGEFLLIVLGVMVALAGDDWRDARQESQTAKTYLERLAVEAQAGASAQATQLRRFERTRDASLRLMHYLDGDRSVVSRDSLPDLFVVSAQTGTSPDQSGPDATYRELVASGQLHLLHDPVTRERVVDYYAAIDQVQSFEESMFPMHKEVGAITGYLPYQLLRGNPRLTSQQRERITHELRRPELIREVREVHAQIEMLLGMIDNLREKGDSLRSSLRAALGPGTGSGDAETTRSRRR